MTMTVYQQNGGARQTRQIVLCSGPPEERQVMALGIIRRVLIQFHKEWTALRDQGSGEAWVAAANALLDRYSHQLYDIVRDVETVVAEDFATEIRCLSADMIKTTNILVMTNCEEDCRERGDTLAKEALRHAERCLVRSAWRRGKRIAP
ncbi:MAG: hypothetical protein GX191_01900 [Candidatus Methanoculleus thermohydrogenotrophicum]|nr:hypothetical protein [Candidatus Methanoculleus thermohydrogenotrophicum]